MTTPRAALKVLEDELQQEVPAPLHSMLQKESRDEAVLKHKARKQMETVIYPPTCTGTVTPFCKNGKGTQAKEIEYKF